MLTILLLLTSHAYGGSICNDGWVSPSEGSGTCSYHGGIASSDPSFSGYRSTEGDKEAQLIGLAFCRSLRDQEEHQACAAGVLADDDMVERTCLSRKSQAERAVCVEGAITEMNAMKEWLETHPPEPPPDPIQQAREIYAQRFGTPADVERLRMRKAYDDLMAVPDELKWMVVPSAKLHVAIQEIGRSQGFRGLTTRDNLPVALKFVVDGTCVTYSESLRLLVMKTDGGNILTISAYGTRKLKSTEEGINEYTDAVAESKDLGSISGEFCFSASTRYPWNK